jgi:hypothetical protein
LPWDVCEQFYKDVRGGFWTPGKWYLFFITNSIIKFRWVKLSKRWRWISKQKSIQSKRTPRIKSMQRKWRRLSRKFRRYVSYVV